METSTTKNTVFSVLGIVLLIVLFGLFYWAYDQFMASYQGIQDSNQVYQKVIDEFVVMDRKHAKELNDFKKRLQSTETLLAKFKEENEKLQEKVALLNKVNELESDIARLKERNNLIINQMSQMEWKSPYREKKLKNVAEAKALLAEYTEKLRLVRSRMRVLKIEDHRQEIATKAEKDKMALLMGNNGYLIRNGQVMPREIPAVTQAPKRKVDVTFVK